VIEVLVGLSEKGAEPGILPDIILAGGGSWKKFPWSSEPIGSNKFQDVLDTVLSKSRASGKHVTFKSLRCLLPTLGNVFKISDSDAQSLSNWQEMATGAGGDGKRPKASFPMSRRYASGVLERAALVKQDLLERFFALASSWVSQGCALDAEGFMAPDAWTWHNFQDQAETESKCSSSSCSAPAGLAQGPALPIADTAVSLPGKAAAHAIEEMAAVDTECVCKPKKVPESSSSSSSSESPSETVEKKHVEIAPKEVVTDLDGLPIRWFHTGGEVHFTVFEEEGRPIPACRWITCRGPFEKEPEEKGVGLSESVAKRGICKSCTKAGFHRVV